MWTISTMNFRLWGSLILITVVLRDSGAFPTALNNFCCFPVDYSGALGQTSAQKTLADLEDKVNQE